MSDSFAGKLLPLLGTLVCLFGLVIPSQMTLFYFFGFGLIIASIIYGLLKDKPMLFQAIILFLLLRLYPIVRYGKVLWTDSYFEFGGVMMVLTKGFVDIASSLFSQNYFVAAYLGWPSLHLFASSLTLLTGISLEYLVMFLGVALGVVQLLIIWLIAKALFKEIKISYYTVLVFSVLPPLIYWQTQFVRMNLALTFLLFSIYLLILKFKKGSFQYKLLFFIFSGLLIFTHHLTALVYLGIIAVAWSWQFLSKEKKKYVGHHEMLIIVLLLIVQVLCFGKVFLGKILQRYLAAWFPKAGPGLLIFFIMIMAGWVLFLFYLIFKERLGGWREATVSFYKNNRLVTYGFSVLILFLTSFLFFWYTKNFYLPSFFVNFSENEQELAVLLFILRWAILIISLIFYYVVFIKIKKRGLDYLPTLMGVCLLVMATAGFLGFVPEPLRFLAYLGIPLVLITGGGLVNMPKYLRVACLGLIILTAPVSVWGSFHLPTAVYGLAEENMELYGFYEPTDEALLVFVLRNNLLRERVVLIPSNHRIEGQAYFFVKPESFSQIQRAKIPYLETGWREEIGKNKEAKQKYFLNNYDRDNQQIYLDEEQGMDKVFSVGKGREIYFVDSG